MQNLEGWGTELNEGRNINHLQEPAHKAEKRVWLEQAHQEQAINKQDGKVVFQEGDKVLGHLRSTATFSAQ